MASASPTRSVAGDAESGAVRVYVAVDAVQLPSGGDGSAGAMQLGTPQHEAQPQLPPQPRPEPQVEPQPGSPIVPALPPPRPHTQHAADEPASNDVGGPAGADPVSSTDGAPAEPHGTAAPGTAAPEAAPPHAVVDVGASSLPQWQVDAAKLGLSRGGIAPVAGSVHVNGGTTDNAAADEEAALALMERQHDEQMEQLDQSARLLHAMSERICDQLEEQHRLLAGLDNDVEESTTLFDSALDSVNNLVHALGATNRCCCTAVVFAAIAVLLLVWFHWRAAASLAALYSVWATMDDVEVVNVSPTASDDDRTAVESTAQDRAATAPQRQAQDAAASLPAGARHAQPQAPKAGHAWVPYEDAAHPRLRSWFGIRWGIMSSWPLQRRLAPSYHFTVGEFLLALLCTVGAATSMVIAGINDEEGSGGLAVFPLLAAFGTVSHNSVWTLLLGIPFERALAWHKFFAYLSVLCGAWHGYVAVHVDGWNFGDTEFLSGVVLWGGMALLIVTSFNPIRRALFEVFMYLHVILFVITLFFGLAHGAGGIIFGFGLYGLDVLFRYLYLAGRRNPREVTLTRLPGDVVRISFPKGNFRYKAGQYVFVNIPSLSLFQWHPFSLSSSPYQDTVMVHIRVLGNWTKALYDMAAKHGKPMQVKAYLEGCYGEPGVNVEGDTYDHFLLISGGIGITPMQSIANELLEQHERGRPLRKLWFVWSVRHIDMVGGMLHWDQGLSADRTMPLEFSPDLLLRHTSSLTYTHEDVAGTADQVGAAASHPPPREETADPLHCDYHLTRVKSLDDLPEGSNVKPEVQQCLRFGRPNLPKVFAHLRDFAKRKQGNADGAAPASGKRVRVAVLACGPAGMLKQVSRLCWSTSGSGVSFDYHGETFDF